jgi:hypothetical protein
VFRSYLFAGCAAATVLSVAMACSSSPPSLGGDDSSAGDTSASGAGQGGTAGVAGSTSGAGTGATAGSGVSGTGTSGAGASGAGSAGKGGGGAGGAGSAGKSGGGAGGAGSAGKGAGGASGGAAGVAGGSGSAGTSGGCTCGVAGCSRSGCPEICYNGWDDDADGNTDCADSDCASSPDCPVGWTCPFEFYNDGTCDCGCGAFDADCAGTTPDYCMSCGDTGSCADPTCSNVDPEDNSKCF